MMEQSDLWNELYRTQSRAWRGVTDLKDLPFSEGARVLEVGCGNGKTLAALKENGYDAVGIDFSEEAVKACARYLGPDVRCECASLLDIPFPDGSFDGAVLFHVLENISPEDMPKAASEVKRILKKGGCAVIRSFAVGDLRSEKGTRIADDTVVRGNGIRYRYFTEESLVSSFPEAECVSVRTVTEGTRFGASRSRIEAVLRF